MARIVGLSVVTTLLCMLHGVSDGGEAWGPASLNDPSAGVFGINITDLGSLSPEAPKFRNLPPGLKGCVVGEVIEGGFIHVAGGRQFDMILALNGWQVESSQELYVASRTMKPGKQATAVILRAVYSNGAVEFDRKPVQISGVVPSRRDAILSRLVERADPVSGEIRTHHIREVKDRTSESQVSTSFQLTNGKPTDLRVVIGISGPSLVIPGAIGIVVGNKSTTFPVKVADIETHVAGTNSAAWVEWPVTPKLLGPLSEIAATGNGTLRFEPHSGEAIDVELGRVTAMQISDVLVGYKLHGGNISDAQMEWFCEQVRAGDAQLAHATSKIVLRKYSEVLSPVAPLSVRPVERTNVGQP